MNKVWYSNYKENFIDAMKYYHALKEREHNDKLFSDFLKEYEKTLVTEFIFESNFIEREGLSEGETKKLILDEFGNFDDIREDLSKNMDVSKIDFNIFLDNDKGLVIGINNNNKNKDVQLVYNQLTALLVSEVFISKNKISLLEQKHDALIEMSSLSEEVENFDKEKKENLTEEEVVRLKEIEIKLLQLNKLIEESSNEIITEEYIKEIHKMLAHGMDNNDNGMPGEYRPSGAYVDFNTVFIESCLIPHAMKKLIQDHISRSQDKNLYNPILEACKVSAGIVRIHPFGDFNGRTSRLILNTIVMNSGLPILIVLRGTTKDKTKYITAMKHYYRSGKLSTYIALVCQTFLKQIEKINDRLELAGVEKITANDLDENTINRLISILNAYTNWKLKYDFILNTVLFSNGFYGIFISQ